jgi:hypothetical protein
MADAGITTAFPRIGLPAANAPLDTPLTAPRTEAFS